MANNIINYQERIKYLIEWQSSETCEILSDVQETEARSIHIFLEKTGLQILIIIPKDTSNINDVVYFGVDSGKTNNALEEGFSEEEIAENIENMIELEDECNAVNFICGENFLRKNQRCKEKIDELLKKY